MQFYRFSAQQLSGERAHSGVKQEGSKKNKFLAEKTGSPHQSFPMPPPLPPPNGNSDCLLRFASLVAGRGCSQMGGNNMPLHAPAECPASLGRGMSACLEVWFEKSRRARAPREPLGHRRSLGHRRKGQSNRARRGGVMSVPEVCGSGERRGPGKTEDRAGRQGGEQAEERRRAGKRGKQGSAGRGAGWEGKVENRTEEARSRVEKWGERGQSRGEERSSVRRGRAGQHGGRERGE